MTPVVFLDIDGVLNDTTFTRQVSERSATRQVTGGRWNGTDHIDPARVTRLNGLIEQTGANVVLSSSWRLLFGIEGTARMLKARGFTAELSGETPHLHGSERHVEIQVWLAANEHARFVILDDDRGAGVDFGDHFVHVEDGLEDDHVERAVRVLGPRRAITAF